MAESEIFEFNFEGHLYYYKHGYIYDAENGYIRVYKTELLRKIREYLRIAGL